METTGVTASLSCVPAGCLLRLIGKVIQTPMYRGINRIRTKVIAGGIVTSCFHKVNFTTPRPSTIDRVLRHHPDSVELAC
jgi:hypothetical protein